MSKTTSTPPQPPECEFAAIRGLPYPQGLSRERRRQLIGFTLDFIQELRHDPRFAAECLELWRMVNHWMRRSIRVAANPNNPDSMLPPEEGISLAFGHKPPTAVAAEQRMFAIESLSDLIATVRLDERFWAQIAVLLGELLEGGQS